MLKTSFHISIVWARVDFENVLHSTNLILESKAPGRWGSWLMCAGPRGPGVQAAAKTDLPIAGKHPFYFVTLCIAGGNLRCQLTSKCKLHQYSLKGCPAIRRRSRTVSRFSFDLVPSALHSVRSYVHEIKQLVICAVFQERRQRQGRERSLRAVPRLVSQLLGRVFALTLLAKLGVHDLLHNFLSHHNQAPHVCGGPKSSTCPCARRPMGAMHTPGRASPSISSLSHPMIKASSSSCDLGPNPRCSWMRMFLTWWASDTRPHGAYPGKTQNVVRGTASPHPRSGPTWRRAVCQRQPDVSLSMAPARTSPIPPQENKVSEISRFTSQSLCPIDVLFIKHYVLYKYGTRECLQKVCVNRSHTLFAWILNTSLESK